MSMIVKTLVLGLLCTMAVPAWAGRQKTCDPANIDIKNAKGCGRIEVFSRFALGNLNPCDVLRCSVATKNADLLERWLTSVERSWEKAYAGGELERQEAEVAKLQKDMTSLRRDIASLEARIAGTATDAEALPYARDIELKEGRLAIAEETLKVLTTTLTAMTGERNRTKQNIEKARELLSTIELMKVEGPGDLDRDHLLDAFDAAVSLESIDTLARRVIDASREGFEDEDRTTDPEGNAKTQDIIKKARERAAKKQSLGVK
ncbi:MAG: hypothetical protein A2284_19165 [Deltaproteobacteria bacterium RIFOXYA12_FULL_61_11]|nr:MAG: hypothetical protein A2284_19165 [Deltaproteobacteria bacterium RIFOXYA12_FULL_61_11]